MCRHNGEPRTASSISLSISASSFCSAFLRRWMLFSIRADARFSRCPSAVIIWIICRRRAIRSASAVVSASASGLIAGLVAWANRAITAASIGSVFARLPSAWAKARTCAGLTTTTGSPAAPRPAATTLSRPPVASTATSAGASGRSRSISASMPAASRPTANAEPAGRTCTSNLDFATSIPTTTLSILSHPCLNGLRLRPQGVWGATVRVRWNGGRRPRLPDGLRHPRRTRATDRHRDWHHTR